MRCNLLYCDYFWDVRGGGGWRTLKPGKKRSSSDLLSCLRTQGTVQSWRQKNIEVWTVFPCASFWIMHIALFMLFSFTFYSICDNEYPISWCFRKEWAHMSLCLCIHPCTCIKTDTNTHAEGWSICYWWNSYLSQPVHKWMVRHIYFPCLRHKVPKVTLVLTLKCNRLCILHLSSFHIFPLGALLCAICLQNT